MVYYKLINFLPAEIAVPGVLVHGLDAEMIVFMLAAGICRLDAQLIRCIDELRQAFLQEREQGRLSMDEERERERGAVCAQLNWN